MQFSAFNFLKPKSIPFPLVRIGGDSDGSYVIPDDLSGLYACFSPGVYRYKYFEDELTQSYNISSHLCDYSSSLEALETPLIDKMQTFHQLWLDLEGMPNSITLDSWVNSLVPSDPGLDLILQMDIEGAEYRTLFTASAATIQRFRIIVIELHGLHPALFSQSIRTKIKQYISIIWSLFGKRTLHFLNRDLRSGRFYHFIDSFSAQIEPYLLVSLLKKLARTHMSVHAHPNNYRGYFIDNKTGMNIPEVLEITLLRKDRLSHGSCPPIQPILPHPLDIHNSPLDPPIYLNSCWLISNRRIMETS